MIQQLGEDELVEELMRNNEDIKEKCEPMREWRNRKLSHSDLKSLFDKEKHPMPPISYKHFGITITKVNEFINAIGKHLKEPNVIHEEAIF